MPPPSASPAPTSLVCPHAEEEGSALVLGFGLRLWQSAWSFPSLSFVYKSIVFPLFGSIDNSSSSPSSSFRVNRAHLSSFCSLWRSIKTGETPSTSEGPHNHTFHISQIVGRILSAVIMWPWVRVEWRSGKAV